MDPDATHSYWLVAEGGACAEPIIVCAEKIECGGARIDAPLYAFAPVAATISLATRDEIDSIGPSALARLSGSGQAVELLLQSHG
jgi:hypothetical protein